MNEAGDDGGASGAFEALKARADALERQLQEVERHAALQIKHSALKAEAVRAGIVDVDGLRLLDPAILANRDDEDFNAGEVVGKLRQEKPWLFVAPSSSSITVVPAIAATKRRLAMDMSLEEWRAARADLLRRR